MKRLQFILAAVLLTSGLFAACRRGPVGLAQVDAGVAGPQVEHRKASTDLRTSLLLVYPEYRSTAFISGEATLTRVYARPLEAGKYAQALGWKAAPDGGIGWNIGGFDITQPAPNELSASLRLSADAVGALFTAPAGPSTDQLAMYLPRDVPTEREFYRFELQYGATPTRSAFLTHQLVEMTRSNGQWDMSALPPVWATEPDGGAKVPEQFEVRFTERVTEARNPSELTVHRELNRVTVTHALVTDFTLPSSDR